MFLLSAIFFQMSHICVNPLGNFSVVLKVFRSIGYRSIAIDDGIPFDDKNGVVSCESNDGHVTGLPGIVRALLLLFSFML